MEEIEMKKQLMELAYKYYPYNIADDGTNAYYDTREYKRLKKSRLKFDILLPDWDNLLLKIKSHYNLYELENWVETATVDHCFIGRLVLRKEDGPLIPKVLVFNISFITPLYFIYKSSIGSPSRLIPTELDHVYKQLKDIIYEVFPNYIELSTDLANQEINGISYNGVGRLLYEESEILENMTLFNAFFSCSYY